MLVTCPKCNFFYDDAKRWTVCPHNLLEAGPDSPRGTNQGYCADHDLYACKFPHESKVASESKSESIGKTEELDRFDEHVRHVGKFLSDMYAIMIDPLAEGELKVDETCAALLEAARRHRELENGICNTTPFDYTRKMRQAEVLAWAVAAFGEPEATSVAQRGLRLLEEAAEAAQAAGVSRNRARAVVQYVYSRPIGELKQEVGGVGITLLCLGEAAGIDVDQAERDEIARVMSKPLEHFRQRNQAKNDAGLVVDEVKKEGKE